MLERVIDSLGKIADNVWAMLLFAMAGSLALAAHFGHDKDLFVFAGSVAMTGSAVMHANKKPE